MIDGKYEYFAFISYKEEDAEWAKWLQRKLEHYKLPTALRKEHPHLPERISPIYEYKSEAGGGRLKEVIWKGLTCSKYLIVICSPHATRSNWLNDGIRHFIESGQEEHIIPFIVDGKPKAENPAEECFPSALLDLKGDRELRGININEMGRDAAAVKVIAHMFDVKFDTLWQRYEREIRLQQRRKISFISGGVLILAVASFLFAYIVSNKNTQLEKANVEILQERDRANAERDKAEEANWKMMENRARVVAKKGEQLINKGDSCLAILLALEILPTDLVNPDKPYTPEAEGMLRHALIRGTHIKLQQHKNIATSASFSPDGKKIVSVATDSTIRIWDTETGMLIKEPLTGHTDVVYSASFSPDGRNIVSIAADSTIRIWNVETGEQIGELKLTESSHFASFSSDGEKITIEKYGYGSIKIWDVKTGKQNVIKPNNNNRLARLSYTASLSLDGKKIVSALFDHTIRIWNADTGEQIGEPLKGQTGFVRSASFSPDGKKIVSASNDETIRIWDAETRKLIGEPLIGPANDVSSASFSPDGKKIVLASKDNTIRIWDAETGKQIGEPLKGHTDYVRSASFSLDGKRIVSASDDETIRIWDAETGIQIGELTNEIIFVSASADGKRIISASSDGNIQIWETETKEQIRELLLTGHTDDISFISFSPDGKKIVSASDDETIRIWDAETGKQIGEPLTGHTSDVNSASFSPDGKKIVSASNETIRIWDAETGIQIGEPLTGHTDCVFSASFSPDGKKIVSASDDETIRIWDAETGIQIGEPLKGHTDYVLSASFSPDGKKIVSASDDETIRIWDAETGIQIGEPLKGHTESVNSVSFSPDGRKIVSASDDNTIRIWEYPPLQELIDQTRERFKDRELTPEERRMYYLE